MLAAQTIDQTEPPESHAPESQPSDRAHGSDQPSLPTRLFRSATDAAVVTCAAGAAVEGRGRVGVEIFNGERGDRGEGVREDGGEGGGGCFGPTGVRGKGSAPSERAGEEGGKGEQDEGLTHALPLLDPGFESSTPLRPPPR